MRKMPLNQIAFGKTDAFNELNTFGQEYFMESFVANPKYHIDDFLSGSRFFVCGKKGTGKSALLKYLECHFLKDESNLVFPIRFKSEIEQVDKDSFEEIASAPDNSTKNEKYDTSSILDQSSYLYALQRRGLIYILLCTPIFQEALSATTWLRIMPLFI